MKIIESTRLSFNEEDLRKIIKEYCIKEGYDVEFNDVAFNYVNSNNYSKGSVECVVSADFKTSEKNV